MSKQMETSWLVQRLERPRGHVNPFSFGGGIRNGGLSDEATDLLRGIFSFDYMGAAEYEWGAVPEALNRLANAKLTAGVVATSEGPVFLLCQRGDEEEIAGRIQSWTTEDYAPPPRVRDHLGLRQALTTDDYRTCGWLELDNGFFFFTDEPMWRQTCELFGVKAPAAPLSGGVV